MKKIMLFLVMMLIMFLLFGCNDNSSEGFYLNIDDSTINVGNENISITIGKEKGNIIELVNLNKQLYFVKNQEDSVAIRAIIKGASEDSYLYPESMNYSVLSDTNDEKIIQLNFEFENGLLCKATIALDVNSDEITFHLSFDENEFGDHYLIALEYPIIEGIESLKEKETDYFLSSFATGYLFNNPIDNFSKTGESIEGDSSFYPSGFGNTMQFQAYYSENNGGFYMQTNDSQGDTIRKMIFTSLPDDTLKASVWHYLSDVGWTSHDFDYDLIISNLYEGNWYEAANKYKTWATNQYWCTEQGILAERDDLNLDLYENTVLAAFIAPAKYNHRTAPEIYNKIKSGLNGKILYIPYYNSITQRPLLTDLSSLYEYWLVNQNAELYNLLYENDELIAYFESTDLSLQGNVPSGFESTYVRDAYDNIRTISFGSNTFIYQCASSKAWTSLILKKQEIYFEELNASGLYNDIGLNAPHPFLCYDFTHSHGTYVNIYGYYYELMKDSYELSREYNKGFTGQEMISELTIPYLDFYQARANGGVMSEMEHDAIMGLVENGSAVKIPLFEYLYHEYGSIRIDSFTLPIESIGTPYYYVTAYTVLNGGIPEYNWEFTDENNFPSADSLDQDMIDFIGTLGDARTSYGQNYLVYGDMVQSPETGVESGEYYFSTPLYNNGSWSNYGITNKTGTMSVDKVIVSAYEYNGKTAIFLVNITEDALDLDFGFNANNLYGISSGTVTYYLSGVEINSNTFSDGIVAVNYEIPSREVVMLVLE